MATKTRRTPKKPPARRRVRKSVVTLKPLTSTSKDQAKIQELEAEVRQLKAQLAEQRNSSTVIAPPLPAPVRTYKGAAITFGIISMALLIVVLLML